MLRTIFNLLLLIYMTLIHFFFNIMFTLFVISCAVISINETYRGSYTPLMKNTAECCSTDDGYKLKNLWGNQRRQIMIQTKVNISGMLLLFTRMKPIM